MTRRPFFFRAASVLSGSALVLTAFVSVPRASGATLSPRGTVKVLAAGSLPNVLGRLNAAFSKATGYSLQTTFMGSTALATDIKSKTILGDVFVSASPSADAALEGTRNGSWISHYSSLASSPVVLAYRSTSPFAHSLATQPWYNVITSPSFVLGRTDPAVDPGGVLDLDALKGLGYAYNLPALLHLATNSRSVYPEEALPGLLQAGQLDGAFMYAVSADAAHLPYVPLSGTQHLNATYTIATLKGAPDPRAAAAFLAFLTSPAARAIMRAQGLVVTQPSRTS